MKRLLIILFLIPTPAISQSWDSPRGPDLLDIPGDRYYMDFILTADELVGRTPEVEFETLDKARFEVPVSGEIPGTTFEGTLSMPKAKAQTGNFSIVEGTLIDLAGNVGPESVSGAHLEITSPLTLEWMIEVGWPEVLRMKASAVVQAVTPYIRSNGVIVKSWASILYWYAPNPRKPYELIRGPDLVLKRESTGAGLRWAATLFYMQPTEFEIRIPRGTFRESGGWVNNNTTLSFRREIRNDAGP